MYDQIIIAVIFVVKNVVRKILSLGEIHELVTWNVLRKKQKRLGIGCGKLR
jgi:hypothetical protein